MTLVMDGIALDDPLRQLTADKLGAVTRRGRLRPTATRVAFSDENGPKGGVDIRCTITVEVPRQATVHASAVAETPRLALDGAVAALERELIGARRRRRDLARRPKKYFAADQAMRSEGETPPPRRRRSA